MKITRRQLKQIIDESLSLNEVKAKDYALGAANAARVHQKAALLAAAIPALGIVLVPPYLLAVTLNNVRAAGHGYKAGVEVSKAKREGTQKFILDVIRRAASKTLKKIKGKLPEEQINTLHKAIMSGTAEDLATHAGAGLLPLDIRILNKTLQDMKSSASVETVDLEAVEKELGPLRASVT